jgi:hypothetical protein
MAEGKDNKGRFTKGNQFGSNSKRAKGVVRYIMEKTNNLQEVLDMAYEMLQTPTLKASDRIKLIELFLDRSIGKPVQHQKVDSDTTIIVGKPKKDA